jgi:hypothetical protein
VHAGTRQRRQMTMIRSAGTAGGEDDVRAGHRRRDRAHLPRQVRGGRQELLQDRPPEGNHGRRRRFRVTDQRSPRLIEACDRLPFTIFFRGTGRIALLHHRVILSEVESMEWNVPKQAMCLCPLSSGCAAPRSFAHYAASLQSSSSLVEHDMHLAMDGHACQILI